MLVLLFLARDENRDLQLICNYDSFPAAFPVKENRPPTAREGDVIVASIFQRGKQGTWWIKYYVDGEQVYRSLKTTVAREALRVKKKIEGEEACGMLLSPSRLPLPEFLHEFCEFLQTIRAKKSYKNNCSVLRLIFGPICPALEPSNCVNRKYKTGKLSPKKKSKKKTESKQPKVRPIRAKTLEDVTTAKIEEFISSRIRFDGIAPKTANQARCILHRMFSYAIKTHDFVASNPRQPNPAAGVERRREPAHTIRYLEMDGIDRQLASVAGHAPIGTLVAVYIYAVLRREEALWLTPSDIDFDRRLIHVRAKTIDSEFWQPKTKRNRVVPISVALLEILDAYQPHCLIPWFFPSPQGKRWDPDNLSRALRAINQQVTSHGLGSTSATSSEATLHRKGRASTRSPN